MDDKEARKEAAKTIAKKLGEVEPAPLQKREKVVKVFGIENSLGFLQKTLDIEAHCHLSDKNHRLPDILPRCQAASAN